MADLKISQLTGATTPLAGTEVVPLVQSSTTKKVAVSDLTAGRDVSMKSATVGGTAGSLTESVRVNSSSAGGSNSGIWINAQCSTARYNWLIGAQYNLNQGFEITASTAVNGGSFTTPLLKIEAPSGDIGFAVGNLIQGTAAKGVNFTANTPAAGMTSQLLNWYEEGTWTPTDQSGASLSLTVTNALYTRIGRQVVATAQIQYPSTANTSNALIGGLPFATNSGGSFSGTISNDAAINAAYLLYGSETTFRIRTLGAILTPVTNAILSSKNLFITIVYMV